jgi:hypothetical protein
MVLESDECDITINGEQNKGLTQKTLNSTPKLRIAEFPSKKTLRPNIKGGKHEKCAGIYA